MRRLARMLTILLVGVVLGVSAVAVVWHQKGNRLLSVQTSSMKPFMSPGDAVFTQKTSLEELKAGDVISYQNPADKRVLVSHRIIDIDYESGKIITKGDAVELTDLPLPYYLVVGKVQKAVPYLGSALNWLRSSQGLMLVVYTPAAIIFLYEIKRLSKLYSHHVYRLYGLRPHH